MVVAAGDVACPPGGTVTPARCRHTFVAAQIAKEPEVGAVLVLGDLQYEQGTLQEFRAQYDRSWGLMRPITYPVPGNHEYLTRRASGYFDYFGVAAGEAGAGWYRVDVGESWRLLALNSNCGDVGCGDASAQLAFVRDQLETNPRRCTLAYWHHPRWSSNASSAKTTDRMRDVLALLDSANAELVLNGHAHQYERFAPMRADGTPANDGVRHITVGTGGSELEDFARKPRRTSEAREIAHGYLRLRLLANGYTWAFVDEDGRVLDEGSGDCH